MLSPKNRVNKELFQEIMEKGKSVHSLLLSLRFLKSGNEIEKKFAVAVSKKSYSKAVDRNLLKRRARSILNKNLKTFPNILCIVFLKKGAKEISFQDMQRILLETFQKVG